ncbi:hypothetical protein P8452_50948 [Trifolium repens]|nr:hypothetical protein P8452_50948 [Trifolium repens]
MRKSGWLMAILIWLWLDGQAEQWWFSWRKTNQKVKSDQELWEAMKKNQRFGRLSLQEIKYGANKKEVGGLR